MALAAVAVVGSCVVGQAPADAAFPGINGRIACASNRSGNFDIWTFDPNGTELNPINLTNHPANDGKPRYSPDGRQIAFESNRDGRQSIYIMNADGTNVRRVTNPPAGADSIGSWSPGGDQLVFQSTRDGNFEVYKINVDGTGETRLTFNPVEDALPAWSPNGDKIAFNSRRNDPDSDIHLMNPDGSNVVNITRQAREDAWPTWSPDGSMIAFHSRADDPLGEEIYRMNADGTGRTRLTFNVSANATQSFDIFPFWSPDGTRIGWNSGRDAANFGEVYHMDAIAGDRAGVVRVTNNPAIDQRCDWQPLCTIYGSGDIVGTPGDDIICGSDGNDRIAGLGGNDRILGLGGNDAISGGDGDDKLFGGLGIDRMDGGPGVDLFAGGVVSDLISGEAGELVADPVTGPDICVLSGRIGCGPVA